MAAENGNNGLIWRAKMRGKTYELRMSDLTAGNLRQMKGWYGKEYGSFARYLQELAVGDVDALACALWMAKRKAKEQVPNHPDMLEFNPSDFEQIEADEVEADPLSEPVDEPTRGSKKTSTESEAATSST